MNNEELIMNNKKCKRVGADPVSAQENRTHPNANVVGVDALIDPKRNNHAITLIALIITIIILLILAGVTINVLIGDHGLFKTASDAGENYKVVGIRERVETEILALDADKITKGETLTIEQALTKIYEKEIFKEINLEGEYGTNDGYIIRLGYNEQGKVVILGISKDKAEKGTALKIKSVSAGNNYSLAIDEENNLWAWGNNDYGQLGDGTKEDKTSPVKIKVKIKSVSAGNNYSLAIDEENNLWAWGYNKDGQLGDGTKEDKTSPVKIKVKIKSISAGNNYSLAIDEENNLWAWGYNKDGQLGDGTKEDKTSEVKIKERIKSVSTSIERHTLAIDEKGNLWAWGYNRQGQLGDGTTEDSLIPKNIQINNEE